jgi:hypothetical protein
MGKQLEHLYKTVKLPILSLTQVDKLVKQYHDSTGQEREEALSTLLKAWHKYFMKYVEIACGSKVDFRNKDTKEFLQLFFSSNESNPYNIFSARSYVQTICEKFEPDEIYNQLCAIFIEILNNYQIQEGVNFTRYVTQLFRWGVKSWLIEIAADPLSGMFNNIEIIEDILEYNTGQSKADDVNINTLGLSLDLKWVFEGSDNNMFKELSHYERYLIYLNFKEEMSLRDMAKKFGRSKNTIHSHLKQAIEKLRSIHYEHEKQSNRSEESK